MKDNSGNTNRSLMIGKNHNILVKINKENLKEKPLNSHWTTKQMQIQS